MFKLFKFFFLRRLSTIFCFWNSSVHNLSLFRSLWHLKLVRIFIIAYLSFLFVDFSVCSFDKCIIASYITNIIFSKELIPFKHMIYSPVQCTCRFSWVCNNWYKQVWNTIIHSKFNNLRVNHKQLYFFWCWFINQADKHRIYTYRFTRTSGTSYKQMRHFSKVGNSNITFNISAKYNSKLAFSIVKFRWFYQFTHFNNAYYLVSNLNTNSSLSWNRCFNSYANSGKVHSNIISKICDFTDFNTSSRLKFISCYSGTTTDVYYTCFNAKACKSFYKHRAILIKLCCNIAFVCKWSGFQKCYRWFEINTIIW